MMFQHEPVQNPPVAERRPNNRRRALLGGMVVHSQGRFSFPCTIRNVSADGARIAFKRGQVMPSDFILIDTWAGQGHRARIAWLTATFIAAHEEYIIDTIGSWVTDWKFIFALAVFLVAALTTSQSTATRTIVPIGLAAGLPAGVVTGMWAGGLGGVYTLPANGTQIAAANFDLTGSTKLGTKLLDHSFFVPMLVLSVVTIGVGALIGAFF